MTIFFFYSDSDAHMMRGVRMDLFARLTVDAGQNLTILMTLSVNNILARMERAVARNTTSVRAP